MPCLHRSTSRLLLHAEQSRADQTRPDHTNAHKSPVTPNFSSFPSSLFNTLTFVHQPHLSVYLQSSRLHHQHPPHFRYCNSQSFNTTIKMKSVQSLAVLGFAAAAQASYGYGWNTTSSEPVVYTTLTTDIYTTYCPEATTFTQGKFDYTPVQAVI